MIIGIPKEIKNHEYRVALVPSGVRALKEYGHSVIIQKAAGEGSGIADAEFVSAGAQIKPGAEDVFLEAEMIVKVKEPLEQEYELLRKDQILFTYLHLAPSPELTKAMLKQEIVGIAYETVQLESGVLPLLTPHERSSRQAIRPGRCALAAGRKWRSGRFVGWCTRYSTR